MESSPSRGRARLGAMQFRNDWLSSRRGVVVAGILLPCALVFACADSKSADPPPPNYTGPVPGAKGQYVLNSLKGKILKDETGAFGGGEWTIDEFAVIPNPVSTQGPVLAMKQGGVLRYLPIENDGDIADLVLRVTGERSPLVKGTPSVAYRNAMKLESAHPEK